jgi:penicillin-binding protein 1A
MRAIDARNAFVMDRLLQEVARSGTAARAQATLKRPDLYGKTGTTNDSIDTWFNGFHPSLVAIVWMGYDQPKSLGDRETGGGLSLPVWIDFMQTALKGVPLMEPQPPDGVVNVGGEWYYEEYARGPGVGSLGMDPNSVPVPPDSGAGVTVPGAGVNPAARMRGSAGEQTPQNPYDKSLSNSDGLPPRPQGEERRSILDLFRN